MLVSAPNQSFNSLFVNVDSEPTDPEMIWDIPPTSGFENRIVSWRGSGTYDNSEFVPKVFNLTKGAHQLIIRGREGKVEFQSISVLPNTAGSPQAPSSPQNLRIVP